jgi:hypothetical protein
MGVMLVLPLGGSASAQAPAPELLPDLQALEAEGLFVDEGGGVRELRLTTTVANTGAGALEIYPVGGGDCDGDGNPNNDRVANQRVYRDADGNGFFTRLADTDSATYQVGCMIFHAAHNHWHFEDFAEYELRAIPTGQVIAATVKVSFCVIDTFPFDPGLPGYPDTEYYDSCDQDDTEGLSVGWSDTYDSSLAGQEIDIQGVPDGYYCLAVTGDPSDILRESDESNNEATTLVRLEGSSATGAGPDCSAIPTPTPPTPPSNFVAPTVANQPAPSAGVKRCKKARKSKKAKRKCRRRAA